MLVEIHGAGFVNKGAQLMLWTLRQRMAEDVPGVRFAVEASPACTPRQLTTYGLESLLPNWRWLRGPATVWRKELNLSSARFFPTGLVRRLGGASYYDVDAFVDISGYAFGDKWPVRKLRDFRRRAEFHAGRGKPVILLPQMFGPFQSAEHRSEMRAIVECATLVYSRDRASLDCLLELVDSDSPHIRLAPDITIFADPALEAGELPSSPDRVACIVPNRRMTDMASGEWGDRYHKLLIAMGETLLAQGVDLMVVPHEATPADRDLSLSILRDLNLAPSRLVLEENPLRLKALFKQASLLIASRYHSIVSALSCGTPAITMGWAHKYRSLLEDFEVPELNVTPETSLDDGRRLAISLCDAAYCEELEQRLRRARERMHPENERMWDAVTKAVVETCAP